MGRMKINLLNNMKYNMEEKDDYNWYGLSDGNIYKCEVDKKIYNKFYDEKKEIDLFDVKKFTSKMTKLDDINQLLDTIDEEVIQNYLRVKKINRLRSK